MVLAFEPSSFFFDRLVSNIRLNDLPNIRCYRMGLSDHRGDAPIYENADNPSSHEGLASLFPVEGNERHTEVITLTTLDSIVATESLSRVDFIKVDVEG